ncbi:ABC transporter permease [Actinocorallia populi]|uniref:ABC transporter permease n=1 Tax=Actinocorallia populi TaxID=2079200 RepID=UPI000D088AC0|nr:ABC transporter permease [Actinocorallia populi]
MTATIPAAQAAVLPRKVTPVTALRNVLTLAWRGLVQIKHNPMELVDLSIQPIMFVLLFSYVFGPSISGSVAAYLPVVIPGIIAQNALFASMSTGLGLNVDITKGVFDRFRSLPIARTAPLLGRILADVVKQAWSMLVVLVVGVVIGFRIETGVLGVLGAFLLLLAFTLMFAWITVLVGLTASDAEKVQVFGFTAIFPLTFLSNAFVVPAEGTPGWLKTFMTDINPVSQLTTALRGLLVGGPVLQHALITLAWAAVMAAVFIPLCLRAFRRRT